MHFAAVPIKCTKDLITGVIPFFEKNVLTFNFQKSLLSKLDKFFRTISFLTVIMSTSRTKSVAQKHSDKIIRTKTFGQKLSTIKNRPVD